MLPRYVWIALGVAVVGAAGLAVASGTAKGQATKYPWLPEEFSRPYTPTVLEWRVLQFNARRFTIGHATEMAGIGPTGLVVLWTADQELARELALMSDRERRAFLAEAAGATLVSLRLVLDPEHALFNLPSVIEDARVEIKFGAVPGETIGIWRNGKVILPGEPGFE